MSNREPLSFDDLEPEGEQIETPEGYEGAEEFHEEDLFAADPLDRDPDPEPGLNAPMQDPLDEYPSRDLDDGELGLDDNDLDPEGIPIRETRRPKNSLPDVAAQIAFKWGSRASASIPSGNGHHSTSRTHPRSPTGLLADEYLDELEADLLEGTPAHEFDRAWAATLRETYELMQALASAATAANSAAEAQGLVAAMAPLSLQLVPRAYRALWPALPALIRGTVSVTGLLHRQPTTRRLITILPEALKNTAVRLAQYRTYGRPISRPLAARVLAREVAMALRRSRRTMPATQPARRRSRWPKEGWDDGYR